MNFGIAKVGLHCEPDAKERAMVSPSLHRDFRVATVKGSGYDMERVPHALNALTRNRCDRSWRFVPPLTLSVAIEESLPLFTSAQHTESIKNMFFGSYLKRN